MIKKIILEKILIVLEKIICYLDELTKKYIAKRSPIAAIHYIGSKFQDKLYNFSGQHRELAAIWKICKGHHVYDLANGTFKWVAVGIPLTLVDKSAPKGDIDLLIAVTKIIPNKQGVIPLVYRVFETKTSKIDNTGKIQTSPITERKKFQKALEQLQKLKDFGAQQIFLLDTYLVQAGYHENKKNKSIYASIYPEIIQKFEDIEKTDFGYITYFLESLKGYNEETSGGFEYWIPYGANILPTKNAFDALVSKIEEFSKNNENSGGFISYCYKCRRLIKCFPKANNLPDCPICNKKII
ncbi:MAG: hypothetical protein WC735_04520 [Candidatus Paceibacterota bacterium]|jgi:hypothetical protein